MTGHKAVAFPVQLADQTGLTGRMSVGLAGHMSVGFPVQLADQTGLTGRMSVGLAGHMSVGLAGHMSVGFPVQLADQTGLTGCMSVGLADLTGRMSVGLADLTGYFPVQRYLQWWNSLVDDPHDHLKLYHTHSQMWNQDLMKRTQGVTPAFSYKKWQ